MLPALRETMTTKRS